jgi:hypothetical protein
MEPGVWLLHGNWLECDSLPIAVKGKILISWDRSAWFTIAMRLIFPDCERDAIDFQFRGRFDQGDRRYTFVLQHTLLGRAEGEGWVAPASMIQHYWTLGDKQRRSGFETLHSLGKNKYRISNGMMAGHYLTSTMEADLERQSA